MRTDYRNGCRRWTSTLVLQRHPKETPPVRAKGASRRKATARARADAVFSPKKTPPVRARAVRLQATDRRPEVVWSSPSVACTSAHVFSRWRALRLFGELTVGCRIVVATIAVGCHIVCLASQLLSGVHAARRSRRRAGCRLSPTVRRGDFDATSANMAPPLLGDGLTPRPPDPPEPNSKLPRGSAPRLPIELTLPLRASRSS